MPESLIQTYHPGVFGGHITCSVQDMLHASTLIGGVLGLRGERFEFPSRDTRFFQRGLVGMISLE